MKTVTFRMAIAIVAVLTALGLALSLAPSASAAQIHKWVRGTTVEYYNNTGKPMHIEIDSFEHGVQNKLTIQPGQAYTYTDPWRHLADTGQKAKIWTDHGKDNPLMLELINDSVEYPRAVVETTKYKQEKRFNQWESWSPDKRKLEGHRLRVTRVEDCSSNKNWSVMINK